MTLRISSRLYQGKGTLFLKGVKMAKKVALYLLIFVLILGTTVTSAFGFSKTDMAFAPNEDVATVNGEEVSLDVSAKIVNNRIMVPIRFIAENLGAFVDWDKKNRVVMIDNRIFLPIGSKTAKVDGVSIGLDAPAMIENGRTLVPLRFVTESLGANVEWNEETRLATVEFSAQLKKATEIYGAKLTDEEQSVINALDDKFAYQVATKLTSFGDALDGSGFHLAGSTAGTAASDYVYDTFKAMGLDTEKDPFDVDGWEYYGANLKVHNHPELNYLFRTAPYTPATPEGGLTADLVYVGTATKDELKGVDLTGKIALAEFDWDNTLWMNNLTYQLESHGAAGVIYFMTNAYGTDPSGMAEFVGDWSGKYANVPVWSMAQKQGFELAALVENEKIAVTAVSNGKLIKGATGENVIAKIKGTTYPNEYIVINAHTDAYNHCLQDDSAPVGVMVALAKAMVDSNYQPERTIVFLATSGEESGGGETFYDWLVGSWSCVNKKIGEWGGKIVNAHTIELFGHSNSTNYGFRVPHTTYLYALGVTEGLNTWGNFGLEVSLDNYMTTSSDEWSFSYMGVPTTRTIFEDNGDQVYHSSLDNPSRFSYEKFVEVMKFQSIMILRTDNQVFAPYDLAREGEVYLASLDSKELQKEGLNVKAMETLLEGYVEKAELLIDLNLQISEEYNKALADKKNLNKVNTMIASYNQAMRDAAKNIIQGVQYVALDESRNQTEYNQRIPKVFEEAIQVLKTGDPSTLLDVFYGLDSDDLGQYSIWYTEVLEYDTWVNAYWEALDMDKKGKDFKWATGRLLQYYDVYAIMESVNEKLESGSTDFQSEINTLTKYKILAKKNLAEGFNKDLAMWKRAELNLPISKAENILAELQ